MPFFDYLAINEDCDEVAGIVDAVNDEVALDTITDQGLLVLSLKSREEKKGFALEIKFFQRVKVKDLVVFSRQLAVMVSATLPVVQALRILVNQIESVALKIVVSEVADSVDGGARLSDALAKYPKVFSNFYVSMVKSGETAGKLDEVLNYLADQQEKDYDLISKTRGAMIYPAFILSGLVVVGFVMMIFVVPKLTEILKETGASLPITTQILITTSEFFQSFWWIIILIMVGSFFGLRYYRKTAAGKKQTDFILLKVPIFGPLIFQKMYLVRFTRSFATLLTGGVSLTEALKITSDIVGNEVYRDVIQKTIREVEDGNSIATVFKQSTVVPNMVTQMLAVGEQTGKLDTILNKLSNFYSREVDNAVGNLVTLIEPLILMLMGLGVGIMVAAILLPMYSLATG
ncbi:MAG: type II secretion system F family protein [Patescibacteria group bacterium]|nr:type II secretion system F family protein [Patescibacteria group bacterium]|tara:strand:- start:1905 stop:3113 length:1209 start_codon:yes stop_codon:yes gene_type:complete